MNQEAISMTPPTTKKAAFCVLISLSNGRIINSSAPMQASDFDIETTSAMTTMMPRNSLVLASSALYMIWIVRMTLPPL